MMHTHKAYGHRVRVLLILVAASMLVTLALAACGGGASQPTQVPAAPTAPAALDGAQLLNQRCSSCHPASTATQRHMMPAQWDQTVTNMMNRGAQLTDAEKQALVDYLTKNYGQ